MSEPRSTERSTRRRGCWPPEAYRGPNVSDGGEVVRGTELDVEAP